MTGNIHHRLNFAMLVEIDDAANRRCRNPSLMSSTRHPSPPPLPQMNRTENATTGSALATELRTGGYTGVIAICTANVSRTCVAAYKARRDGSKCRVEGRWWRGR